LGFNFFRRTLSDSDEDAITFNDSTVKPPKDVYDVIALKEMERMKQEVERKELDARLRKTSSGGGRSGWGNGSFNDVSPP
jgi:hypothetical protein